MARERFAYRDNLADLRAFFGDKSLLNKSDVKRYTGIVDDRTVKKRFPFTDGMISIATLARCLSPEAAS